ncbi:erythromycin esterase family protein [Myroides marinus]|uniref:erythromycin esterase family protein n=1 Tax=Myroides marinus TaxID=703342 RepID=UPI0025785768|nr:erythromycin esterase family protein [Myroides marinus]MDM1353184.1 erythromycin esterase family protein [Myroides marinus]MDM1360754.1 erythromycin esterase family protein [Myroides marinus]MDM1377396.1 erythromycin esterase family protein [Myroides marinus]MDM1384924.1 erythromycin esterase family protein [Myroides marinus]MDM1391880.1 erythromycin esterase family protein [Myroides marinus]
MKILFSLLLILIVTTVNAQELITYPLFPPNTQELNDLDFLKEELKDKQIVMLGEQTHMYDDIFEMKTRVVEYLHKQMGFKTLAMEAPVYDIWKMNQQGFSADGFNNAIFSVWSKSDQFQRLVNYIETNNIKIIGYDSQILNEQLFIEEFFDYLEKQKITLRLDADDFGIVLDGLLSNYQYEEQDIEFPVFEKELNRIIIALSKLPDTEANYHWLQSTKGLLSSAQDAYHTKNAIVTSDLTNKNLNYRDKQMAENLIQYIKRFPQEKVMVWADNIHTMYSNPNSGNVQAREFISMGRHIKEQFKDKVFSIATIHANDSLFDQTTKTLHATPIKKGSFEDQLQKQNKPYLYISSNQEAMHTPMETRLLHFVDYSSERLDLFHDGYIFLNNAPQAERNKKETDKKQLPTIPDRIMQVEGSFKGQLIDDTSKLPIAYATIILADQDIYRITDSNGYYELPFAPKTKTNSSLHVQALGYDDYTVSLHKLPSLILLKANYDVLDELIITKRLTPREVLRNAIKKKGDNHPIVPINFTRYSHNQIFKNDTKILDFQMLSKNYLQSYVELYRTTFEVQQVKWNTNKLKNIKNTDNLFNMRENPIQYSNVLHKRKYKKFKLSFIESKDPEDSNLYVIAFETERLGWNYTNKVDPSRYSGRIYINQDNYAIVKVVETWESTLDAKYLESMYKYDNSIKNIALTTAKDESTSIYKDILNDGRYYATNFSFRSHRENTYQNGEKNNFTDYVDSHLFDIKTINVERIDHEYQKRNKTLLDRVSYNQEFWNNFFKENSQYLK